MPGLESSCERGKKVVLVEGVVHAEDELGVGLRPLVGFEGHVLLERVVDPAQVPLVVEAKAAASWTGRVMSGRAVASSANVSTPGWPRGPSG